MAEYRADSPTQRAPLIGGDAIAARVVVVGRTGLDGRLRLDPAIELIRVRSGFDAIGELANPVGEVPGRTVVFVGGHAEIDERNGGDGAFVSAVRRVAPEAVVARCAEAGANFTEPGAYDRVVQPTTSTEDLRELIHGRSPTPPSAAPALRARPEPPKAPEAPRREIELDADELAALHGDEGAAHEPTETDDTPHEVPDEMSAEAAAPDAHAGATAHPGGEPGALLEPEIRMPGGAGAQTEMKPVEPMRFGSGDGDDVLVAAALGGRDILEPALGLIRARIGRSDVEFLRDGEDEVSPGVEVAWQGQRFGSLRFAGIDAAMIATGTDDAAGRLTHHARWLATWLALAEQQRRLRLEAYTDPVSGAWNRRYFDRFLEAALPHARQHRYKLTVLVFDLDNFKSFNDRFGHEAGDMILTETVRLLRSMTRPSDRICRIGGDEFAVVFYEPEGPRDKHSDHPEAFEVVAGRFQRAVEEQRFPKLGIEAPGELTISGGLATFPWDGQTAAELLRRADELAIASKRAGKNQITLGRTEDAE